MWPKDKCISSANCISLVGNNTTLSQILFSLPPSKPNKPKVDNPISFAVFAASIKFLELPEPLISINKSFFF